MRTVSSHLSNRIITSTASVLTVYELCKELVPIIPSIAKERTRVIPWGRSIVPETIRSRGGEVGSIHQKEERDY